MLKMLKIFILCYFKILFIKCLYVCNKETDSPPFSEYHCSGLKINHLTHKDDIYCCLWTFIDNTINKEISRCSSLSEYQFSNLHEYILNKTEKYKDLNIKCIESQEIFCSNILLDEEQTEQCNILPVSDPKDKYCCRWTFEDSNNYNKKNDYCASINKFEYLNIKKYIKFKNEDPEQRYENLKIDCKSKFIHGFGISEILFLIIILL